MALLLPRSVFFHIPKTGGTWVRVALRRAGLAYHEIGTPHGTPASVQGQIGDRKTFAFVRHPVWWYRSWWSFRTVDNWFGNPSYNLIAMSMGVKDGFREDWASGTFDGFLRNVIDRTPGYLSSLYELYLDNPPVDFIGRTETLADDLAFILRACGERFDEERLRAAPMQNCSQIQPEYPTDLMDKIAELEERAMIRFGYKPDGGVEFPHQPGKDVSRIETIPNEAFA